eukprot:205594-Pyramimonas_sp.AAC.1
MPIPVPPPPQQHVYVLHIFSGQRRPQAVQHYMDEFPAKLGLRVIVLSTGMANAAKSGDLSSRAAVQALIKLILSGQ